MSLPSNSKMSEMSLISLSENEVQGVNGGGFWLPFVGGAIVGGLIYDAVKYIIVHDNEGYGRRMLETGSPGGHK